MLRTAGPTCRRIPSLSISPRDRLRAEFETTLKPRLAALEESRLGLRRVFIKAGLLIAPPFLLAFGFSESIASLLGVPDVLVAVTAFGLILVAIVIAATKLLVPGFVAKANYRARFKREIVGEIFKIVAPAGEYEPFTSIAQADFDASGLFNARGSYWSDDRVRGRIGVTPFEAAEVRRKVRTGFREKSTSHSVFEGLFFHLDFNRTLNSTTVVQPANAGGFQTGDRSALAKLPTGDVEFDNVFTVYGTDEAETRSVLTPTIRQGLVALRARTDRPVWAAFKGGRAYLGVHYGRSLFEPAVVRTTSLETLERMAEQFALAETVVRELDLNTRVGGKAPDDSLLLAKEKDKETDLLNTAAVTSGGLTEKGVWELATASTDSEISDQDAATPRPATTRVEVRHDTDGVTIAYGLPISFFLQIAASVVFAVVALRALRDLGWLPPALDRVGGLIDTLTPLDAIAGLVSRFPLVALIGGTVVWAFLTLMWVTRVRRVVIRRDAVRIYRGLRPLPRRYLRPSYERIVQVERAVHVGKTGSTGLVNPSASPILQSSDEARWVAAEMRRALRQMPTAH